MFDFFKKRRREALRARPFPEAWSAIISKNVLLAARLAAADRHELEGLVQIFMAEKRFEGCGGLELTDEIRVTIAAQACLLLLHRDTDMYPEAESILVYPHAYIAPGVAHDGIVMDGGEARLGESWTRGVVVLAWDHVKNGAHNAQDGHNVVLHEFAHQLDAEGEGGTMDGAPELGTRARYTAWARVLGEEYAELSARLHAGRVSDIDSYGATAPAEFFAVVTEMFFEKSRLLKRKHPELYAELAEFYRQDPAAWAAPPGRGDAGIADAPSGE